MIDDVDTRGRTALWWAAARGDHKAVRTLLEYGASIYGLPNSHSALHVARTPEVVRLFLEYGANIDCRDESERTPLHCCAYRGAPRGGSVELLVSLLEGGADINAQSAAGYTALHYAAMYGFVDHMAVLLNCGAPVDCRKPNGNTPLLDAVECSQANAARFLLENGADIKVEAPQGRNLIHIAAGRSDIATMNVIAGAENTDIDVDAKDHFGMTPKQCFEKRQDKSDALSEAFEDLLEVFRGRSIKAQNLDSDSDDESEVFEDAVEINS